MKKKVNWSNGKIQDSCDKIHDKKIKYLKKK